MNKCCKLSEMKPGDIGIVSRTKTIGGMRRRLLDIGLVENTAVECIGKSPGGGLSAFLIRGAVIALRNEDSSLVLIKDMRRKK